MIASTKDHVYADFLVDKLAEFTGYSHASCPVVVPLNIPKKAFWICLVITPAWPVPITFLSIERTGVTSAAVPVKKTSSAK